MDSPYTDERAKRFAEKHLASVYDALEEANRWQSMETAPKDGTDILIYVPGHLVMMARWAGHGGYRGPSWCSAWYGAPLHYTEPTHWRPVPKPPTT